MQCLILYCMFVYRPKIVAPRPLVDVVSATDAPLGAAADVMEEKAELDVVEEKQGEEETADMCEE